MPLPTSRRRTAQVNSKDHASVTHLPNRVYARLSIDGFSTVCCESSKASGASAYCILKEAGLQQGHAPPLMSRKYDGTAPRSSPLACQGSRSPSLSTPWLVAVFEVTATMITVRKMA